MPRPRGVSLSRWRFLVHHLGLSGRRGINARDNNKPVKVYYIGDYDPAGVLIDVALERELRKHLHSDIEMTFTELGITEEQIREYRLPGKPRKETDRRALHIAATVEAEAMPAGTMRELLRTQIEALLPAGALAVAKVAERSERQGCRSWPEPLKASWRSGGNHERGFIVPAR